MVEAVINDVWCDARITKVIPPTQEEIQADEAEDEVSNPLQRKIILISAKGCRLYGGKGSAEPVFRNYNYFFGSGSRLLTIYGSATVPAPVPASYLEEKKQFSKKL